MRVLFMGTPDFAAASLETLVRDGFEICGVVTKPDMPQNRGMKTAFSPVKEVALVAGLPVYQPETLRDESALALIRELDPDLIIVVAYGKILPQAILDLPRLGCVNLHGSVLPKYRGSAPIQWAVLNGDETAGVCTTYMTPQMDAGDVIYTLETPVGDYETSGELFCRLRDLGAGLLSKTAADIAAGTAPRFPQDEALVTYAPKLTADMSPIDWNRNPRQIVKQICGLNPWPVASTTLQDVKFRVWAARYSENKTDKSPGLIVSLSKAGLEIACAEGSSLYITTLQAPGGKRMAPEDYFRGHPIDLGGSAS